MRKVYFASGMENMSLEEVRARYLKTADLLESHGFEMVNRRVQERYFDQPCNSIERIRQVVEDDLKALRECDLLLVDYSIPDRNYVGSTCEIVYAHLWGKPVVVYVEESNNDQRCWLRYHATYICKTLSQALKYMVSNYR